MMKADRCMCYLPAFLNCRFVCCYELLSSHASKASVGSVVAASSIWLTIVLVESRIVWLFWSAYFHWALVGWSWKGHRLVYSIASKWRALDRVLSVDVVYVSIVAPADRAIEVGSVLI